MICPECGLSAREVHNPFHGTGLAVHQNLIDCPHCEQIFIVGNRVDESPKPVTEMQPRPRGFAELLRSTLRRKR